MTHTTVISATSCSLRSWLGRFGWSVGHFDILRIFCQALPLALSIKIFASGQAGIDRNHPILDGGPGREDRQTSPPRRDYSKTPPSTPRRVGLWPGCVR